MAERKPRKLVPYTEKIGKEICLAIASGESLSAICVGPRMPDRRTVFRWTAEHPEFREQYWLARSHWCDTVAEDLNGLADSAPAVAAEADAREGNSNAAVAALRLQIDSKKWLLSKLNPGQFGDRLSAEVTGAGGSPLVVDPPSPTKVALGILALLRQVRREAEPPVVEHEAPPDPAAEPVVRRLTLDPDPDPRYQLPARTLLATSPPAPAMSADQEASVARERVRLRLVQFDEDRLRLDRYRYDPRGGR